MNDQNQNNNDLGENETDRFDAGVAEAARKTYNQPPETPRDEMWSVIRAARAAAPGRGSSADDSRGADVIPMRRFRPKPWWAAVAAALVIGVALGRGSLGGGPEDGVAVADGGTDVPAAVAGTDGGAPGAAKGTTVPRSYRVAAARHLTRTESFLTMFRVDARADQLDEELGPWAKRLLTDTRLLLDSPAGGDPELRILLSDLELVLAQIVQLRGGDPAEVEIIDEGLESSQLLFRLRAAKATGPATVGL
jgi:hypothetical protein